MNQNPYRSPSARSISFYTDDITLLPARAIVRISRRQGIVPCTLILPFFLIRKLLGLRFKANYGTCRVTELAALAYETLPETIWEGFAPFEAACRADGFEYLGSFWLPWIGHRWGASSIWLHKSGLMYSNMTHIEIRLRSLHKAKSLFACHSVFQSGDELHTSAVSPEDWIPEIVPPKQVIEPLPPNTEPGRVIEHHRIATEGRQDIVRFTAESLMTEIVRTGQRHFDYMVASGYYSPLSAAELENLLAVEMNA